jgi:hypothetical protein
MIPIEEAKALIPELSKLTEDQFAWVSQLVQSMALPVNSTRSPDSDVIPSDKALGLFFLYLVTHHTLSVEPFKKEKFEYALERVMEQLGRKCSRPNSRTNPGLDLIVDKERWSLKSESSRGIKKDFILISKWMELGKGDWGNDPDDLKKQCQRFMHHLTGYDRILLLRCLTPEDPIVHHYELLELPYADLLQAMNGRFEMKLDSTQKGAIPGYCFVNDETGTPIYRLYFDGGTERKLRVQNLRKDACIFHAEWRFESLPVDARLSTDEEA